MIGKWYNVCNSLPLHLPPASCSPIHTNAPPKGLTKPLPNYPGTAKKKPMIDGVSASAKIMFFDHSPCTQQQLKTHLVFVNTLHHGTTGKLVSNRMVTIQEDHRWSGSASTALPQTMRTLESQRRREFVEMSTWQVLQPMCT